MKGLGCLVSGHCIGVFVLGFLGGFLGCFEGVGVGLLGFFYGFALAPLYTPCVIRGASCFSLSLIKLLFTYKKKTKAL